MDRVITMGRHSCKYTELCEAGTLHLQRIEMIWEHNVNGANKKRGQRTVFENLVGEAQLLSLCKTGSIIFQRLLQEQILVLLAGPNWIFAFRFHNSRKCLEQMNN